MTIELREKIFLHIYDFPVQELNLDFPHALQIQVESYDRTFANFIHIMSYSKLD
jgi:hypothetical protein